MDPVTFEVSNPSGWTRTDYVQVDLEKLNIPRSLDESTLELLRVDGQRTYSVPFQVDDVTGCRDGIRVLVFLSTNTPAGSDNYTSSCAKYILREVQRRDLPNPNKLRIGYYHYPQMAHESGDGFSYYLDPSRTVTGLKLVNGTIDLFVSLVGGQSPGRNGKGAVLSVVNHHAFRHTGEGEILSPFWQDPTVYWGQVTQLSFFPLPWERKWFYNHRLAEAGYQYELVYSKNGPVRAAVCLKTGPITIRYDGQPVFAGDGQIECDFYRLLYVYPEDDAKPEQKPYYFEELFVLTTCKPRRSVSFRPYYASVIAPEADSTELKRFEHIPDYFVVWKHFGPMYRGYGFASDSHVRGLELQPGGPIPDCPGQYNQRVFWRLPLSHHNRCVHYFWFLPELPRSFDPFHSIGHEAWYEKIFKPLAPVDPKLRFPTPIPGYEGDKAEIW